MKLKRSNPLFANFFRANVLTSAMVISLSGFAGAAEIPYKSTATSTTDVNLGTNWQGDIAPGSGDIAAWTTAGGGGESRGGALTISAPVSWLGLKYEDSNGPITFSGSDITLGASGITQTVWENLTVNNNVILGADQTWNIGGTPVTLNGTLTGSFVLTKSGGNALNFTNTALGAGLFKAEGGNTNLNPATPGSTVTIQEVRSRANVNVGNNGLFNILSGNFRFDIAGGGYVQGSGTGTTGRLTTSTGTLDVSSVDSSGTVTTGNLTTADHRINIPIVDFNGSTPLSLVKSGSNQLGLGAVNTFTGTTTVNGGRINADNVSCFSSGAVNVNSGGQVFLTATGTYANNFNIEGPGVTEAAGTLGALRFNGSNTVSGTVTVGAAGSRIVAYGTATGTISGSLAGSGNLEINTTDPSVTGTINLTGNSSAYTADITFSQGTLNVNNAFGGSLIVNGGRANINGAIAGDVTVADLVKIGGENTISGTLNLGSTSGGDLHVDPSTLGALTAGTVNLVGTNYVILDKLPSASGPFDVLDYTTLASGDESNLTVTPGIYRGDPAIVHDIANTKFTLELDSQTRTWNNAALTGNWNTTDANWVEGDFTFFNGDDVAFTDTAVGTVNLGTNLQPLSITLSNTVGNNYIFAGGSIIGTTGITMGGGGNLTLGGTNTFTGAVAVNSGVLTLNSQQALGQTSGVTVASNTRVDLNGQQPGALGAGYGYTWTIAGDGGDGAGNLGAITNTSGTATYGNSGVKSLVLSGNAEIGGNNGRFDVGSHAGAGTSGTINGNGNTLTKVGSNQIVVRAPSTAITYVVNAGTLNFEDFDTASGINKITVNNTAVMGTYGPRTLPNEVDLNTGTTLSNLGGGNGTWTGTVNVLGNATFNTGGGNIIIDGALAGSGNITRSGGNTLVLQNAAASYGGKIVNNGGTLRIESASATGTAAGADVITMASGTTLQGGTIAGQATATVGTSTTGITQTGTGNVNYDAGAGATLTIAGPVTGTGNLIKTNNSGALVFSSNVGISGKTSSNGGSQTFNGNLVLGTGSAIEVGGNIVTNLNSPTLTVPGGILAWTGTTNIAIGTGTVGRLTLQEGSNQPHTVNHTAGALTVASDIRLGHWSGGVACVYNISGGSLNQPDTVTAPTNEGQANLFIGIDGFGNLNISGSGVVNTTSLVVNGRGGTTADTLNLTGGRLNIGRWGIRNPGTAFVNLGGGTVGAWASDWSSSTPMTLTGTGGNVSFDTLDSVDGVTARNISLTGVISGTGGLTKKGVGGLSLSNAGTTSFTGTAKVEGGSLYLNGGVADDSTVWAVGGGTVQPGTFSAAGNATAATLNLDGGIAGFRLGTSTDKFTVPNFTVTSASKVAVYPATGFALNTPYTIVDYTGAVGGLGVAGGLSLANPHLTGSIADDTTNTLVTVTITGADAVLWKGNVNGTWNVESTSNWVLASNNATSSVYYNSDSVRLTDLGLGQPTITLVGAVTPGSVSVENTTGTYTLQGTGIGGGAALTKSGAGSLTLLNTNTYTGTSTITDGTVTVGNGGTTGVLGGTGGITLGSANASLVYNRSDTVSLDRTVTATTAGDGSLIKNGSGTLNFSGSGTSALPKTVTVNQGTLQISTGNFFTGSRLQSGGILTVNSGATLLLSGSAHALGGTNVNVGGLQVILNGGTLTLSNEQYLQNLTMNGATINGSNEIRAAATNWQVIGTTPSSVTARVNQVGNANWNVADVTSSAAADLTISGNVGNAGALVKTGAGTLVLTGVENNYTGGTAVNGGILEVASVADPVLPADGDDYANGAIGSGYLGVANDATFRYTGTTAETTVRPLWIDTGSQIKTIEVVSATGAITFTSTAGNINKPFRKTGAGALTIADQMVAGAAVTVDAGTLTLGGANTYTADTIVNGGTLVIDGDSISDDGKLVIDGTGVVNVTNNETVQKLFFGGSEQAIGTYGATGSGATFIDDTRFSGPGIVTVTGAGYSSWITTFGLPVGDQDPTDDPDNDGVSNAVEWVLGGNPATGMDAAKLPTIAASGGNMVFTFKRDQDSKVAGTAVKIEVGTTLAGWPTIYTVGNNTAGSSAGVTVTDNLDGTDTITLTVAQAPDAAKFARLGVTIN